MSSRKTLRRRRGLDARGITILESMISLGVLAIGMSGLLRMQIIASSADNRALKADRAAQVAKDTLTFLQTVPFGHPALQPTTPPTDLQDQPGLITGVDDLGTDVNIGNATAAEPTRFDQSDTLLDEMDPQGADSCTADCLPFLGYSMTEPTDVTARGRPHLDFNGDGRPDFRRFWRVIPIPSHDPGSEANSARPVGTMIVVVVRWYDLEVGIWRQVEMVGSRFDPELSNPTGT